jgi:hypothetical protein
MEPAILNQSLAETLCRIFAVGVMYGVLTGLGIWWCGWLFGWLWKGLEEMVPSGN